jgi:hypothetical protein
MAVSVDVDPQRFAVEVLKYVQRAQAATTPQGVGDEVD